MIKDLLAPLERMEPLVLKDHKVILGPRALLELMVPKALKDHKEIQDQQEQMENPDLLLS